MAKKTDDEAPFRLACACASLRRAARAVTQVYDGELREAGLRSTQYTLLQALSSLDEIGQRRLGALLAIDTTTLSRTLQTLESAGWIETVPAVDRRKRRWRLTQAGREKWMEARPLWMRAQAKLRDSVRDVSWDDVLAVSDAVTRAASTIKSS